MGSEAIVVVECKSGTSRRLPQGELGRLAFVIRDVGAEGGIMVSPLDLQAGAKKVAANQGVVHVCLPLDATPKNFVLSFLDRVFAVRTEEVQVEESVGQDRWRRKAETDPVGLLLHRQPVRGLLLSQEPEDRLVGC